jgi:polyisoprenoid-binding protein YceI
MATVGEKSTEKTSTWTIDPAHSSVECTVRHMLVTSVRGRFAKFDIDLDFNESNPERSSVEARIDAASIDTRNDKRDAHLRSADFLDVEQYPYIVFKSRRIEPMEQGSYRIVGDLTIHDVTREVVLDAAFAGIGKSPWGTMVAGFNAETRINRKDYGLTWNVGLETGGVMVGDEVRISLDIEAVKQA